MAKAALRRAKVSVSVDAALLRIVDRYVAAQGIDRSGVFDNALRLWYVIIRHLLE